MCAQIRHVMRRTVHANRPPPFRVGVPIPARRISATSDLRAYTPTLGAEIDALKTANQLNTTAVLLHPQAREPRHFRKGLDVGTDDAVHLLRRRRRENIVEVLEALLHVGQLED